jgi:signal transduction histidine kinase
MNDDRDEDGGLDPAGAERRLHAVAGLLASGVAGQISRPLRQLRENLALVVETLDRYVTRARGPTPYPWKSLQALRQQLADTYLLSRNVARLAGDLAGALEAEASIAEPVDVNKLVEAALNLARHRIGAHTEVFVDLGMVPLARAVPGQMILAIAKMIVVAADSAAAMDGAALSVRTRRERDEAAGTDEVIVFVADNGRGMPSAAAAVDALARPIAAALGGSFSGASEAGTGSAFELRLPAPAR